MSEPSDPFEELGLLAAACCDGAITPDQAARLEALADESPEARRYLLRYVQLHGELYWDHAAGAGRNPLADLAPPPAETPPKRGLGHTARRMKWIAAAAAVLLAVAAGWLVSVYHDGMENGRPSAPPVVARITGTVDAKWSEVDKQPADGTDLTAGQELMLRDGLAEITFSSGARVILEGPAEFAVSTTDGSSLEGGYLARGHLAAKVPAGAEGFAVRTPAATVVDLGTEFGLAVEEDGQSEIHVFAGTVRVSLSSPDTVNRPTSARHLRAGQAVGVRYAAAGERPQIYDVVPGSRSFARTLPVPGSVAALRTRVARHPSLLHHYTFEGATPDEKRRDKRGGLHLIEVVMSGGRGGGSLDDAADGIDPTTRAVRPFRAPRAGNTNGVSLQSEAAFQPPPAMTVELLLCLADLPERPEQLIGSAVATRANRHDCGFFVVAVDRGQLVHLMEGDAPWIESGVTFVPGDWYYVAGTFRTSGGTTTVNTYLANLSDGERVLRHVVRDEIAGGTPAASRLGIGKGFDENIAHAYPWSGSLDEVAIYDDVLDVKTLQTHLDVLTNTRQ